MPHPALRSLWGCWKHESIIAMVTRYKPNQWRGKRLVYRSTDTDEPKHEIAKVVRFLVAAIIGLAIILLISRWAR